MLHGAQGVGGVLRRALLVMVMLPEVLGKLSKLNATNADGRTVDLSQYYNGTTHKETPVTTNWILPTQELRLALLLHEEYCDTNQICDIHHAACR